MELQLGLALPNNDPLMLQLAPLPWLHSTNNNKKRRFESAFVDEENCEEDVPKTLPLFLWDNNRKPNDEDGPNDDQEIDSSFASSKKRDNEGVESLIGWPPINPHRRKQINCCFQSYQDHGVFADCFQGRQLQQPAVANPNSKYVKVKMEGMAIARKIDLTIHHSFSTLKQTLFHMFGICQENFGCYELIYQDTDGDWLLAEDQLNWRSFIGSAQRLKLKKNSVSDLDTIKKGWV